MNTGNTVHRIDPATIRFAEPFAALVPQGLGKVGHEVAMRVIGRWLSLA
jgi:hypothetical protein